MKDSNLGDYLDIMKYYSGVIKKHSRLLTREEEFEYISTYQAPIKKLEGELRHRFEKELTETTNQYNSRIKLMAKNLTLTKGSKYYSASAAKSLDKMVKHNLGLIMQHAKKATAKQASKNLMHLQEYDHFIEGLLGFIHALDKFDLTRKTEAGLTLKSSTYTTRWIRQNIRRGIQDHEDTIRIPIHIHDKIDKLRRVMGQWCSDHPDNLSPPPKQLAALYVERFIGEVMTEEECARLGRYIKPLDCLDAYVNEDENQDGYAFLAAESEKYEPDTRTERSANKVALLGLINQLEEEEDKRLMFLRYGLVDGIDREVKEVAHVLMIKPREVERREREILQKLKDMADPDEFNY